MKSYFLQGTYVGTTTLIKALAFGGKEYTYQAWNGLTAEELKEDRKQNPYTYDNETDNYQQDHYQLLFSQQFGEYINFNAALHYTYGRGYYEQYKADKDFAAYGLENITIGEEVIESTDLIRQKWLDNEPFKVNVSIFIEKII